MTDPGVLAAVWGETGRLTPRDGSDAAATRLEAVVAKLAAVAGTRGLGGALRKREPPRIGSPEAARYRKAMATVETVESGNWSGVALPERAALWELAAGGGPRLDPPMPKAVSWITGRDVASGGDFVVDDGADGRVFRLFESPEAPEAAEPPFASAVTGSGLAAPKRANPYARLAWGLGIAAAILFLLGGTLSVWTGRSMSNARNLLVTTHPLSQYRLLAAAAGLCEAEVKVFPAVAQSSLCEKLLVDGTLPAKIGDRYDLPDAGAALAFAGKCPAHPNQDGCSTIWRAAIDVEQEDDWRSGLFAFLHGASAYLTGVGDVAGSASILIPFLMLVCGIAGVTVALGLGTRQRVAGVWIDSRNRVSLARAQVTLWTAVALAGYAAFAMFNVGFAGIAGAAAAAAGGSAVDIAQFGAFPKIPASIAAALGIATASPMLSALILPRKDDVEGKGVEISIRDGDDDPGRRGMPFLGAQSEGLAKRSSPLFASIADIFMGEERANAGIVDVSRLQNVVITVSLVLGFFSYLVAMMTIDAGRLIGAGTAIFTTLPEMGSTFTSLLLASHATYLVSKAHDARDAAPAGQF